jgi:MoaA/NifB/PqqE/SkfB family radical SAM enzyme
MVLDDMKKYKFKTTIESNFSMITEKQRNILKDIDVRFITSLDGSKKELQEFLRPQCYYDEVINNIKFFVKCGKRVIIRMTITNYNFYDMIDMIKLAEELKVESVIFHQAQYLGVLEQPYKFGPPLEDMDYIKKLVQLKHKVDYNLYLDFYRRSSMFWNPRRGIYCVMDPVTALGAGIRVKFDNLLAMILKKDCCPISRNFIKVDIDGKIYFCSCHECESRGDLSKNSLDEILDNDRYDKIRQKCSCKISKRFIL